jgi:hypothetical protein
MESSTHITGGIHLNIIQDHSTFSIAASLSVATKE